MFALGLLLPIISVPDLTSGAMHPQWALLSLVLPAMLWRLGELPTTWLHTLWAGFVIWAIIGITWAPQPFDAVFGVWVVLLWGLIFQLGFATANPVPLYSGLACGLSINVGIATIQWLGYHPVPTFLDHNIAGLLYNRTVLGAACALTLLACVEHRRWGYTPILALGIALSGSRGAALAIAFAFAARWSRAAAISGFATCAILFGYLDLPSDHERLQLWGTLAQGLTIGGIGPWTTSYIFMHTPDHVVSILAAHNDPLQLVFEFGLPALVPIGIVLLALAGSRSLPLWGWAALACFWFPAYTPVTAFIAIFTLGRVIRELSIGGRLRDVFGPDLPPSPTDPFAFPVQPSGRTLSLLSRD